MSSLTSTAYQSNASNYNPNWVQPITSYGGEHKTDGVRGNYQAKAFWAGDPAGSGNETPFYVTHDGYLKATDGRISSWLIDSKALTNGYTGLGSTAISGEKFGQSGNVTARIWS